MFVSQRPWCPTQEVASDMKSIWTWIPLSPSLLSWTSQLPICNASSYSWGRYNLTHILAVEEECTWANFVVKVGLFNYCRMLHQFDSSFCHISRKRTWLWPSPRPQLLPWWQCSWPLPIQVQNDPNKFSHFFKESYYYKALLYQDIKKTNYAKWHTSFAIISKAFQTENLCWMLWTVIHILRNDLIAMVTTVGGYV